MDSLRDLLHKIQTEDSEKAFRELFDLQYDRLFRLSFYYLQNDEWAKETAFEAYCRQGRSECSPGYE